MATVRWIGNAQGVKQVTTIAVTGTWATNDTATLTINDKNVTVTVGTDVSTSNIADILARAVNGSDDTPNLLNDETRNVNGQEVPEFTEVVASNSAATLTLTSATAGVPFTVTASEVTAGTGALGSPTAATAATGPNFVDNADNYEGGSLPSDGDTVLADSGSVSMLYGLTYFPNAGAGIGLNYTFTTDYTGSVGLPRVNALGYVEYRQRYLQIEDHGGTFLMRFNKGVGSSSLVGAKRFELDSAATMDEFSVDADALPNSTAVALEIIGGAIIDTFIQAGNVLIGDPAVSGADVELSGTAYFGKAGGAATDCYIDLANASISGAETITQHSGTVEYRTDMTYTGGGSGTWTINDGIARYHHEGASRPVVMNGGILYPIQHEGPSTAHLYGDAEINFTQMNAQGGNNDYFMAEGTTFRDPGGLITTSDFYTVGCTLADVTIITAPNGRYTQAAGATIS